MTEPVSAFPLQVDIVSDVVCPWCIIGYKQLQKALALLPGQFDVSIRWHPFELNPQMPAEGQELREHLAQKYGAQAAGGGSAKARLIELGQTLGFEFEYFDGMRMGNTFRAHQLLHWAAEQGCQTPLKLALFEAFFSRREDVSDLDVLVDVAGRVGLATDEARNILTSEGNAQAVREEQHLWREKDIHAVPAFFFNEQYFVPGAQEAETFVRVLNKIKDKAAA